MITARLPRITEFLTALSDCRSHLPAFYRALLNGFFVSAFFFVFKPFGVEPTQSLFTVFIYLSVGLVNTLILLINRYGIKKLLSRFIDFERESAKQTIIWSTWSITFLIFCNYLYVGLLNNFENVSFTQFLGFLYKFFAVAFFVILVAKGLKSVAKERSLAQVAPEVFHGSKRTDTGRRITLSSDAGINMLSVDPADLLFIRSDDNYVTAHFYHNGKIETSLFRNTLKNLEQALSGTRVVRCHRKYIVNLRNAVLISGNSQGLSLKLKDCNDSIPVSRKYTSLIRKQLTSLN